MSLKDRCEEFLHEMPPIASVDDLVAFVTTEIGRASHDKFDNSVPLALYFNKVEDRDEFVDLILAAKPGLISKRWPA
jgi:hypothetical protein